MKFIYRWHFCFLVTSGITLCVWQRPLAILLCLTTQPDGILLFPLGWHGLRPSLANRTLMDHAAAPDLWASVARVALNLVLKTTELPWDWSLSDVILQRAAGVESPHAGLFVTRAIDFFF